MPDAGKDAEVHMQSRLSHKKLRLMTDAGRDAEVNLQSRLSGQQKVKELDLMPDAGRDAEVNMQSRLSGKHNSPRPFKAGKSRGLICKNKQGPGKIENFLP